MSYLELRRRFAVLGLFVAATVALVGGRPTWGQGAPPSSDYIEFLEPQSMLYQADQQADRISGMGPKLPPEPSPQPHQ